MISLTKILKSSGIPLVTSVRNLSKPTAKKKMKEAAKTTLSNKSLISTKLQEFLHLKRNDAIQITSKHKLLSTIDENVLTNNFNICKTHNLTDKLLLKHPEILAQQNLEERVEALRKLPYPIQTTCSLLLINTTQLKNFVEMYCFESQLYSGGRIKFLSTLFQESEEHVCEKLVRIKFLQNINLEKLTKSYSLVLSFGLSREDINKDLWALKYSYDTINERLTFASRINVGKLKLWMVRANPEIFDKYVGRIKDNQQVLGNHSLIEYLSEKLDCTDMQAKTLLNKLPAIGNKSMKKMQEMLDFLYTKGFKPIHIYRVPKILLHSVTTVGKRLKEIENHQIKLDSLYMLTKSQKQYQQYYEALLRNKKSKNYED